MKGFYLFFALAFGGVGFAAVNVAPAHDKLKEVIAEVRKNNDECIKNGKAAKDCDKAMRDELYANGLPRDWFEKGDKEYKDFWQAENKAEKK